MVDLISDGTLFERVGALGFERDETWLFIHTGFGAFERRFRHRVSLRSLFFFGLSLRDIYLHLPLFFRPRRNSHHIRVVKFHLLGICGCLARLQQVRRYDLRHFLELWFAALPGSLRRELLGILDLFVDFVDNNNLLIFFIPRAGLTRIIGLEHPLLRGAQVVCSPQFLGLFGRVAMRRFRFIFFAL